MNRERISGRTLGAWLAASLLGPMAQFLGAVSWNQTLLLGAGSACLSLCTLRWGRVGGRILPWIQILGMTLLLAAAAGFCGDCWAERRNPWFFPAALLALAAVGACGGPKRCGAAGAALFWGLAGMMAVVLVFAAPELRGAWLRPSWKADGGWTAAILLLPAAGALLPREKGRLWPWMLGILLTGAGISLITAGCIAPWVARDKSGAFFAAVQMIQISGVAERFDALIAGVMTLSWYCLLSLLLSGVRSLAESQTERWKNWAVWGSAGAAFLGSGAARRGNGWAFAGVAAAVLVLAPLLPKKTAKKDEKGVDKGGEV